MLMCTGDKKVINMIDAMNIVLHVKKYKKIKRDKYVEKLQEWHEIYNNLNTGWIFIGEYMAVKAEGQS